MTITRRRELHRIWMAKQTEDYRRNRKLVYYFGITIEQYNQLLEKQAGVCAICRLPESVKDYKGRIKALAVDHNHAKGGIRGLLCQFCNQGLGYFKDNPGLLTTAISYLAGGTSNSI